MSCVNFHVITGRGSPLTRQSKKMSVFSLMEMYLGVMSVIFGSTERKAKTLLCEEFLGNTMPHSRTQKLPYNLNRDLRYKRERPSHFRQHLISILIKSCSARGRSDLFPKELQNKTTKPNGTGVNPFVP